MPPDRRPPHPKALVNAIAALVNAHYPSTTHMAQGQIRWTAVHKDEKSSYGKTIAQSQLTPVVLDLLPHSEVQARAEGTKLREIKKQAVARLFTRAYEQQGVLTNADGIVGLEDQIMQYYPQAAFQKCVVHKMRNILNQTRPKDKEEVAEDFKEVFNNFDHNSTLAKAKEKVAKFIEKWRVKYPTIKRYFDENTIKYDPRVRRLIYTSNSIENINRAIRKATKNKLSFESPDRLLDYTFMVVKEFEEKNLMKYPVTNYKYFTKINNA